MFISPITMSSQTSTCSLLARQRQESLLLAMKAARLPDELMELNLDPKTSQRPASTTVSKHQLDMWLGRVWHHYFITPLLSKFQRWGHF